MYGYGMYGVHGVGYHLGHHPMGYHFGHHPGPPPHPMHYHAHPMHHHAFGGFPFMTRKKRLEHLEKMREVLSEWLEEVEEQLAELKKYGLK